MMKPWFIGCCLALLSFPLFAQEPERKPGRIQFDVQDVYLDTLCFRADTVFTQPYPFVNVGESPLTFAEVSAGCSCITVDLPKEPVPAGEASEVVVHFTPHWAGDFHHSIGLVTDGSPRVRFITLNVVLLNPDTR